MTQKELNAALARQTQNTEDKIVSKRQGNAPSLNFAEVRASLTESIVSEIFQRYAPTINPDAKIENLGSQIKAGSLYMAIKGDKIGLWKRFSNDNAKGDIFSFVEAAAGYSKYEALKIVAEYAGIPLSRSSPKGDKALKDSWEAFGKVPHDAQAFNPKQDLACILNKNHSEISNTYEYKNKDGELLGFVVRIVDKYGKKQTMPVTYCHNQELGKSRWQLKGFTDNNFKPIYGAEKLEQYPLCKILIVEGEKSADAASKLFPEYTVISWMGGAMAAAKPNWKHLEGREVIIWPDNDEAGQKAALAIEEELNKVNGFRGLACIVDTSFLNLPEKWDLADALPSHLTKQALDKAIDYAQSLGDRSYMNNRLLNKETAEFVNQVANVLNLKDLPNYIYFDSNHTKLDLKEDFYKEMFKTLVVSFMQDNGKSEVAKEINEGLRNLDDSTPTLTRNFLKVYQEAADSSSGAHFINKQFMEDNKDLAALNIAELVGLHQELTKDFFVFHKAHLGVASLTETHQAKISQDIAKVIKSYGLKYKGNREALQDSDYKSIVDETHKLINNKDWWDDLARREFTLKKESIEKAKARIICNVITKNLWKFDVEINKHVYDQRNYKSNHKPELVDFKGNSYKNKFDYLESFYRDKEIMSLIKSSGSFLNKQIYDANIHKEKYKEKIKTRDEYELGSGR